MADINQRTLWRKNPYWKKGVNAAPALGSENKSWGYGPQQQGWNPYVSDANRADITKSYGTEPPVLNMPQQNQGIGALATPVQPPLQDRGVPMTEAQASSPPGMNFPLNKRHPAIAQQGGPVRSMDQKPDIKTTPNTQTGIGALNLAKNYLEPIVEQGKNNRADLYNESANDYIDINKAKEWAEFNGDPIEQEATRIVISRSNGKLVSAGEIQRVAKRLRMEQSEIDSELNTNNVTPDITDTYPEPSNNNSGGISDLLLDSSSADPAPSAANSSSESSMVNFLEENKRPEETLEEFAARIGIDFKNKPYDNWDYIRDMSAGLLASKEDSFLSALGDASLLSNQNRDKAETNEESKRTQLALAKWKSDDDWDQLLIKQKALIEAATVKANAEGADWQLSSVPAHTFTENGRETKLYAFKKGMLNAPGNDIVQYNGGYYYKVTSDDMDAVEKIKYERLDDLYKRIDNNFKPEDMEKRFQYQAEQTYFNSEVLSRIAENEDYKELFAEMRAATEEGTKRWIDLIENGGEGSEQAAAALATALNSAGGLGKMLHAKFQKGLYNQLTDAEQMELFDTVKKEARRMASENFDPNVATSAIDYVKPATAYVMKNMNWDEDGKLKFGLDYTSNQLNVFRDTIEESAGIGWMNTLMGGQSFPENHPLSKLNWETPWNRPDENSVFNKSQWVLLEPDQKDDVFDMGSSISSTLQRDFNVPESQATSDLTASLIDSNSVGGGKDMIGWNNQSSKLRKPSTWYVEPPAYDGNNKLRSVKELRNAGVFWNGFKGEWFTFRDEDGVTRRKIVGSNTIDELKSFRIK